MADLTNAVKFYFSLGFNHSEILECLARMNGVVLSLRSLRRILASAQLFRRKNHSSDILDVALFITEQVEKSGQLHGYRRSREVKLAKQMETQVPLEDVKKCCLTDCGRSLFQRQALHWKRRADHSKSIAKYFHRGILIWGGTRWGNRDTALAMPHTSPPLLNHMGYLSMEVLGSLLNSEASSLHES